MLKTIVKTRGPCCSLGWGVGGVKYTWNRPDRSSQEMGRKWEVFIFILCDSEPPFTTLTERRASYACLYKHLFPVAGWEEGLTLDQGFRKASSLVDKWWESQKGRLGGQALCTGFHILLHSRRVLPDKVITCLSQRDLKDQVTRPLFYGQGADEMGHDSTSATSEGLASSVWWRLIGNSGCWNLHQMRRLRA